MTDHTQPKRPFQHYCSHNECPYLGQPSVGSCGCHEQPLQVASIRLEEMAASHALLVATLEARDGWKPIETAPKDGTICDLWLVGGGRITDIWWDDEDKSWCGLDSKTFSHWMAAPVSGPAPLDQKEKSHA